MLHRLFGRPHIDESESSMLSNIDAVLVTNGDSGELTFRSHLSPNQRSRGRDALLRQMRARKSPGVYIWRDGDNEATYRGTQANCY